MRPSTNPLTHTSINTSTHPYLNPSIRQSLDPSIPQSLIRSIHQSITKPIHQQTNPSIRYPITPSTRLRRRLDTVATGPGLGDNSHAQQPQGESLAPARRLLPANGGHVERVQRRTCLGRLVARPLDHSINRAANESRSLDISFL